MPRTKRPAVSKKDNPVDEEMKQLDRLAAECKSKIEQGAKRRVRDIELAFKILSGTMNPDLVNKTVGQLKNELLLRDPPRNISDMAGSALSRDDGYLTENSTQGSGDHKKLRAPPPTVGRSISTVERSTGRRSRSADTRQHTATGRRSRSADTRQHTAVKMSARRRSKSVYKTPAYNKSAVNLYPAITPKVAPHSSVTVLRQPRQGEMVVSMSGSPVMVPTYNNMQTDEKANCNIMLRDGTMLSLQPKQLRQSSTYIPFTLMDTNVLRQLNTLKENLEKVVKMGEMANRQ